VLLGVDALLDVREDVLDDDVFNDDLDEYLDDVREDETEDTVDLDLRNSSSRCHKYKNYTSLCKLNRS
jgi:hypothetical protein